MQFLTIEDLKQLAAKSSHINEDDTPVGNGLSFNVVCRKYLDEYQECLAKLSYVSGTDAQRQLAYKRFSSNFLSQHCPPIKLVGEGSSRTAYACEGGKCLKIAQSDAGIAQNKHEFKLTYLGEKMQKHRCFAQTYSRSEDYSILLTECCSKISSRSQLAGLLGFSGIDVMYDFLKWAEFDGTFEVHSLVDLAKNRLQSCKSSRDSRIFAEIEKYAEGLLEESLSPGQTTMLRLFQFWKENGTDELLYTDLTWHENWGLAIRDSVISPVVLDAGYSLEVDKEFY